MKVAVATDNPIKMRAVEHVVSEMFGNMHVRIQQLSLDLDLPEQPMGKAIAEGAVCRAQAAQRQADADVGIGIEAGLMQLPGTKSWMSVQVCAIADRTGECSMGMGPGYELPQPILDAVLSGEPLREAFERVLEQDDPERRGAIFFLSDGAIDRMDLTTQAVRMALIPWSNVSID